MKSRSRTPGSRANTRPPSHPNLDRPPTCIGDHGVHEAAILPEVDPRTRAALRSSLRRQGLQQPIVLHEGRVLIGRARLQLCMEMGLEPRFEDLEDELSPLTFVLDEAFASRQLGRSGRAITAARAAGLKPGRPAKTVRNRTLSIEQAATLCGVSVRLVKSARKVLRAGLPKLVRAVELEMVSVSRAEMLASMPEERQREFIARLERTTTAKERAELVAEFTGKTSKRQRDPWEAIRDLASHVREAEDPAARLAKVLENLAKQAGVSLPRPDSDPEEQPAPPSKAGLSDRISGK